MKLESNPIGRNNMNRAIKWIVACLFCASPALAQQPASPSSASSSNTTVRGCLRSSRGNFIVIEDGTNLAYALRGVGNTLNGFNGHEVEVKGELHPGSMKTGVRSSKEGSNPADTVHGIEGIPLQVADVSKDVRTVAKHCKAADEQ
jgi:hypothetical protein